jgi:hypothetical protein
VDKRSNCRVHLNKDKYKHGGEEIIIYKIISRITMSSVMFGLMFGLLLIAVGCAISDTSESTSQDENITTIETVLNHQFTGPDEEIKLMKSPENVTIIGAGETTTPETPTKFDLYLKEKYHSHFTDNMYSQYIVTYALDYQTSAYYNDYQLEVASIIIEQHETIEGAYDFMVSVLYKKKGNEEKTAKVTGRAYMNEESKITFIRFINDNGLLEEMQ